MAAEAMTVETDGPVTTLTLRRPHLLNAMDYAAACQLETTLAELRTDGRLRILIIRGEGRAFCTGIDLKELSAGETPHDYYSVWDRSLRILEELDAFVVCVMHGYAIGGGLQIGLASDIRIVTDDCVLGLPAIQESIIPGLAPLRLPRYVGLGRAKWLILSGESIDGRRAYDLGLADHVVPAAELDEHVADLAAAYLKACSVGARQSKLLLGLGQHLDWQPFYEEYLRRQAIALDSADHEEARSAYREGREPRWS